MAVKALKMKYSRVITWDVSFLRFAQPSGNCEEQRGNRSKSPKNKISKNLQGHLKGGKANISIVVQANGNYDAQRAQMKLSVVELKQTCHQSTDFRQKSPRMQ